MLLPDFMPIENDGMSVITAIVLFFLIVGGLYFIKEFSKSGREQDKNLNEHRGLINELKVDIAEMKGDVKETRSVMKRIETGISEMQKTYQAVLLTNLQPKQ